MPPFATWETQARVARVLPGLEEAAAVAHPEAAPEMEAGEEIRAERRDEQNINEP